MHDSIVVEIAGLSFMVSCQNSGITHEPDPSYAPFLRAADIRGSADITVTLDLGPMPVTAGFRKVFDSGESWALFCDRDEYYLTLNSPACREHPVWIARFGEEPDRVTVHCSDILIESADGALSVSNPFRYPLDQLLLIYVLARKRGALIHAAGVSAGGRGYIFPGRSGAGKSTISKLLLSSPAIHALSDDRVAVREIRNSIEVFGTPWPGEGGMASNETVPLSGIFFILHGKENRIERIDAHRTLQRLLPVVSVPWYDPSLTEVILRFCDRLIADVPAYELHFVPGPEVADVFRKFVSA